MQEEEERVRIKVMRTRVYPKAAPEDYFTIKVFQLFRRKTCGAPNQKTGISLHPSSTPTIVKCNAFVIFIVNFNAINMNHREMRFWFSSLKSMCFFIVEINVFVLSSILIHFLHRICWWCLSWYLMCYFKMKYNMFCQIMH